MLRLSHSAGLGARTVMDKAVNNCMKPLPGSLADAISAVKAATAAVNAAAEAVEAATATIRAARKANAEKLAAVTPFAAPLEEAPVELDCSRKLLTPRITPAAARSSCRNGSPSSRLHLN